jgi:DNA-binding NarL/FixJ family response regulator
MYHHRRSDALEPTDGRNCCIDERRFDAVTRNRGIDMTTRLSVRVHGTDPITEAGVASQMRGRPEVHVLDHDHPDDPDVAVIVVESLDDDAKCWVRSLRRGGCGRVVAVCNTIDDGALMCAVELGVSALLRRSEASPERLSSAVVSAARGDGAMAPDLLGRLLAQMNRVQNNVLAPRGIGPTGFTLREVEVLRLLADGCDTSDIAVQLAYSERTIKNVIHDLTSRLQLRNRSHAVAYAMRAGVI